MRTTELTGKLAWKRVYDPVESGDGARILVDRLWPRGVKKEDLKLDDWIKSVTPGGELRKWFGHREERWEEFSKRYRKELDALSEEDWKPLLEWVKKGNVTLLTASKNRERHHVLVLIEVLKEKFGA